eukprot:s4129_g1.t1
MKKLEPMPNAHNEPGFDHAVEETSARQQCLCLPLLDMLPKPRTRQKGGKRRRERRTTTMMRLCRSFEKRGSCARRPSDGGQRSCDRFSRDEAVISASSKTSRWRGAAKQKKKVPASATAAGVFRAALTVAQNVGEPGRTNEPLFEVGTVVEEADTFEAPSSSYPGLRTRYAARRPRG